MATEATEIFLKQAEKYVCELCDFSTSKKLNYTTHISTSKHKKREFGNTLATNPQQKKSFFCDCGKEYSDRTGVWRHKKKCSFKKCDDEKEADINSELIPENINNTQLLDLIFQQSKENIDLKHLLLEQNKIMMELVKDKNTVINNTNTNTNTNSHNKTFNLQFFLNETCKNAMNITDFVDSIKLQLSDLESVGKLGYVEGLSKIIIRNLKALDVTERPVHCSDSKRDTMYVKDEDKWEKENEENHKVLKAIEDIADKNSKMVKEWKQQNPECASSKSHKADVYSHIMIQAVCSNNDANNNKILKKIAKEVTIDKN
jgi:hypothetical protein